MNRQQFRALYREFLFRLMDVELLAPNAKGDSNALLGQFASLLIFMSCLFSLGAMSGVAKMATFFISSTMLAVGVFALLSWDSTFLDRRDVLVLGPLPVRGRTIFFAKVTAVAAGLCLTVASLHCICGMLIVLAIPLRVWAAYWVTMLLSGAFLYSAMLAVQGVAAQLPRRLYLGVSSWLQMILFALFISVFFLMPQFGSERALVAPENQRALAWLPPYWFLGLFAELGGLHSPVTDPLMARLAGRAVAALAIALSLAAVAFLLSYFRTLRRIVEEPDIAPGQRGGFRLPAFGGLRETALVQFAIRTLFRNRQPRMILSFYLGMGLALILFYLQTPIWQRTLPGHSLFRIVSVPMLVSSVILLCVWLVGTRVAFGVPVDLRANWIFRVLPIQGGPLILRAARRSLLVLSVLPAWIVCTAAFLWLWPWRPVAIHILFLALIGSALTDAFLGSFPKIPFTCSYLPGKSKVHMIFALCLLIVLQAVEWCIEQEGKALETAGGVLTLLAMATALFAGARWFSEREAREETNVRYEETGEEFISLSLGGG